MTYIYMLYQHLAPKINKPNSWKEMLRFWSYLSMFHCLKQHESYWPHALLVATFDCHIVFVHLSDSSPETWNQRNRTQVLWGSPFLCKSIMTSGLLEWQQVGEMLIQGHPRTMMTMASRKISLPIVSLQKGVHLAIHESLGKLRFMNKHNKNIVDILIIAITIIRIIIVFVIIVGLVIIIIIRTWS